MTKFRISVLDLEGDKVVSRKLIGEPDLDGLHSYLRETLELSDERTYAIETELQSYTPFRFIRSFETTFEIVAFDEEEK